MPNSLTVCIDANLVFRRVAEPSNDAIQALWQRWHDERWTCIAPRLVLYEVTNALHRARLHGLLSVEAAVAALQLVLEMPLRLHDEAVLHEQALALATRFALPAAYDAHYLALAAHQDAEFWTTDRRLVAKVQDDLPWVYLAGA
jgi:predicted nucleic acid-binding protein